MINMNKFEKRLRKLLGSPENALVIGTGFGKLEEILEIFKTVFVTACPRPEIKSKNLVYLENFESCYTAIDISVIFIDLSEVNRLVRLQPVWTRWRAVTLVEGNDVIGRDISKPLWDQNYRAVDQHGIYHVWKREK